MEILYKIILALVQGFTEVLPISSSGHLIFISSVMKVPIDSSFIEYLHLWTGIALVVFYWERILLFIRSKNIFTRLLNYFFATFPVVLVGVLFGKFIESSLYFPIVVSVASIFWGSIMIIADKKFYQRSNNTSTERNMELDTDRKNLFLLGLSQILALIPGSSRSGITTIIGMINGLDRSAVLNTSFFLGIPVTLGPFLFHTIDGTINLSFITKENIIAGLVTFLVMLLSLQLINKFVNTRFLMFFGTYRILLGFTIILYLVL